jgi:S-ribosylhomocysteine lyase LuxS involved in autoinducer biosynthesis
MAHLPMDHWCLGIILGHNAREKITRQIEKVLQFVFKVTVVSKVPRHCSSRCNVKNRADVHFVAVLSKVINIATVHGHDTDKT